MLHCLSFDHRASSFPLLERLSLAERVITDELAADDAGLVVLATCNRFELYLDMPNDRHDGVLTAIAELSGAPEHAIRDAVRVHSDERAAEHLFAVAAGLRSAVIGEEEIAGQVRRAHIEAREHGTLTDGLERLFQTATRTSRTVKRRTRIRGTGRSLVRLALRIAEARVPSWSESRVLIIGTGAYAGATVSALRARGVSRIGVHSPSGRAAAYAAGHNLEAVPHGGLASALAGSDLVIACSRAEEPVLTRSDLGEAGAGLLIDLGMPRNIDPEVAALPGIDLLDLETIARHASITELGAEAEALEIVREAATEFAATRAERDALPTLLALRGHVMAILEEELCRAHRGNADDTAATDEVATALRRFTGRLLHEPMTRIRELGREGRADVATDALAALFGVEAPQSTSGVERSLTLGPTSAGSAAVAAADPRAATAAEAEAERQAR